MLVENLKKHYREVVKPIVPDPFCQRCKGSGEEQVSKAPCHCTESQRQHRDNHSHWINDLLVRNRKEIIDMLCRSPK